MGNENSQVETRSRRHVIRIAAMLGASAAVGLATTKASQAAGRHSDPFFCEPEIGPVVQPTQFSSQPVCLVRGSQIETASGYIAIENLCAGDLIRTVDGSFKPVRWIGHRSYKKAAGATWPETVDPVLVQASAIAPGVPSRDLFLSPKHALFIDGYLIPVMFLINGATIRQRAYQGDSVDYFHVECDAHAVMFAEGLPVETFRLQDDYEGFANFADHARRFGEGLEPAEPYAPVLGYWSLGDDVVALLRSVGSVCVDLRDPIHVAYDRIAARALEMASAS